jgi:hypothetical protein
MDPDLEGRHRLGRWEAQRAPCHQVELRLVHVTLNDTIINGTIGQSDLTVAAFALKRPRL